MQLSDVCASNDASQNVVPGCRVHLTGEMAHIGPPAQLPGFEPHVEIIREGDEVPRD